jgi:hypothetical protein
MMRGSRKLLLAGFLSFGVTLLVAWPARSLPSLQPTGDACSALTGTVRRGHCAQLTVQGLRFGSVDWQLHPSRLLLGSLSATLRLDQPGLMLASKIAIGLTGKVEARDLDLRLELGALPLAAVPADLRGRVVAHFDAVDWRDGGVSALAGRVAGWFGHSACTDRQMREDRTIASGALPLQRPTWPLEPLPAAEPEATPAPTESPPQVGEAFVERFDGSMDARWSVLDGWSNGDGMTND